MAAIKVFIGSENDREFIREGLEFLQNKNITVEVRVASLYHSPAAVFQQIMAVVNDISTIVIIGGAASATALPGFIASIVQESKKDISVFGVRFEKNPGPRIIEDASFALSLMPHSVPLAYTGFNSTGFLRACMLASMIILRDHR